ncbi:MAG: carbohydrate ABC transporter substrate-binding protein [Dorea sp.]|nr:carbohydrate ABC transporter substrate-binding protein [Dorea sp.]
MRAKREILLVLAAITVFTGCISTQPKKAGEKDVVISVLAGQSTSDAGVEDMIDEWMAENYPHVTFSWECVDWGDKFHQQMQGRFAAGDVPDIMIGKAQDVQDYAELGNLGTIPTSCIQKMEKGARELVSIDGKVYGMPYNAWYQGVIYNKNIFKTYRLQTPRTMEEMSHIIDVLRKNKIVPFAAHYQESWKTANMTMQYMMNDIFKDNPRWGDDFRSGKADFSNNKKVIKSIKNNRFILEHSWEDALQLDQFESDDRFTQGKAAMYLTGSWSLQFANQYGDDIDFGIFPYPNESGDAKLIKETNMTFMKSADTRHGKLIDDIFLSLLNDRELLQEILSFTQSFSVVEGIKPAYTSKIQEDIDQYEKEGRIIDVTVGNAQLVWRFQNMMAQQQQLWMKGEKTLDEILAFADQNRQFSSYTSAEETGLSDGDASFGENSGEKEEW